jgi:hypothetical protein
MSGGGGECCVVATNNMDIMLNNSRRPSSQPYSKERDSLVAMRKLIDGKELESLIGFYKIFWLKFEILKFRL